jgi:hypothetical protein
MIAFRFCGGESQGRGRTDRRSLFHSECRKEKRTGGFFCPPVAGHGL